MYTEKRQVDEAEEREPAPSPTTQTAENGGLALVVSSSRQHGPG